MPSIARTSLGLSVRSSARASAWNEGHLCEHLEGRVHLAYAVADYFPLPSTGTWQYAGSYDGAPATARITSTPGATLGGTQSIKVQTVISPDSGNQVTDTRFYARNDPSLRLLRQDLRLDGLNRVLNFGSGFSQLPAQVNDGQTVHFSQNFTGTRSDGRAWTGQFVGDITVIGLENIRTTSGSFEALKVTINGAITESSTAGWDAHGMISETRWLTRGVGTVRVDYAEGLEYSDIGEQALRYNLALISSSRLNSVMDLQVRGRGVVVAYGDTSPGAPDGTNFTGIDVNGGTKTRLFQITNNSDHAITLASGNSGFVSIVGANRSDFTVVRQPAQTIQPGETTAFTVRMDPSALGFRYATVSIATTDNTTQPFTFDVRGTGILIGVINVYGPNGQQVTAGASSPSSQNGTNFGSTAANSGRIQRVFTIRNTGAGNLLLTGTPRILIDGAQAGDFTVTVLPSTTVAPGGSTTFKISFTPTDVGARSATVRIFTNDRFNPAFTFVVGGNGT